MKARLSLPDILLVSLLLGFTLLYLGTIDRSGLWLDEVLSVHDFQKDFLEMVEARALNGHGPVYFSVGWLWYRLVGDTEWLLRLPSMLAWLAMVAVSIAMVKRSVGPWTAVLAALLLLLDPVLVYLAQVARPYTLTLLFVVLSMAWILRAEDHPRLRDGMAIAIFSALSVNCHYSAVMPLAAQSIYLLARRKPCWSLSAAIFAGTLTVLPLFAFLIEHKGAAEPISWLGTACLEDILQFPSTLSVKTDRLWPYVTPILASLAVWGGLRSGRLGHLLLMVWGTAILVLVVLVLTNGIAIGSVGRYFGAAAVGQTLLIACAPQVDASRVTRGSKIMVVFLILLFGATSAHRLTSWIHPDWRQALEYVRQHETEHDQVYVLGDHLDLIPYEHYRKKLNLTAEAGTVQWNGELIEVSRHPHVDDKTRSLWVMIGKNAARQYIKREPDHYVYRLLTERAPFEYRDVELAEHIVVKKITILRFSLQPATH